MPVTAVIPLKALSDAKGRLASAMSDADRRTFTAWMARRVIAACRACGDVDEVLVIAGDEAAAAVGTAAGARAVVVDEPGLAAAMAVADRLTQQRDATVVIAADLPQVTPADITAVIDAAGEVARAVVVAPTRDGGTGALFRRPPGVITPAYGPNSAAEHARRAQLARALLVHVKREGLANDVDVPAHLPAALALAAEHDVPCDRR